MCGLKDFALGNGPQKSPPTVMLVLLMPNGLDLQSQGVRWGSRDEWTLQLLPACTLTKTY